MNKSKCGFMLLEAILSIVIVSICLTFIAQSLLTNFRTGMRFQEMTRSLMAMENRLGLIYATSASDDLVSSYPQSLEKPYDKFTVSVVKETVDPHLMKVNFKLNWPAGKNPGHLDLVTMVYTPDEN